MLFQKVSIIIPIYNVEKYLHKCIDSVINQTYQNLEIILVDDGSTDDSLKICEEYGQKDFRIKIIHQKNKGLVSARKAGICIAQGKYIGFVDGDDYIEPNMFEALVGLMEDKEVDFVHSGYYKNEAQLNGITESQMITCMTQEQKENILKEMVLNQTNLCSITPSIWSKLFKKDLIKNAYMKIDNIDSYGEDLLCLCHCIHICDSFYIENQAYYHYIIRESSLSHKSGIEMLMRDAKLYSALQRLLEKDFSKYRLKSSVERYFFNALLFRMKQISIIKPPIYLLSNIEYFFDKKIILYGAGQVGQDYYLQLSLYHRCHIIAWIDKARCRDSFDYSVINRPEEITAFKFDYILVAVLNESLFSCIKDDLIRNGIDEQKIIWRKPEDNYLESQ